MPARLSPSSVCEESIDRLPQGVITSDEERIAFILGNQGPDPFFFHILTPRVSDCIAAGAGHAHRLRMSRQFACLRDGGRILPPRDASLGRALRWVCPITCSTATPTPLSVHERQFASWSPIQSLRIEQSGPRIESDLDVPMLQLGRDGAYGRRLPAGRATSPPIASVAWPAC